LNLRLFLVLVLAAWVGCAGAAPVTIYLAPDGHDGYTGTSPAAPLHSLPRALLLARQCRALPGDTVCLRLKGGLYYLDSTLVLDADDSGLIIAAAEGEHPILSGGAPIAGWRTSAADPNVWQAYLPAVRNGQWLFHELFVNGRRCQRARLPKRGFFLTAGPLRKERLTDLPVHLTDVKSAWVRQGDVEIVLWQAWEQSRNQLRALREPAGMAELAGPALLFGTDAGARFTVENAPDSLGPGEWYLDRASGVVSYWPMAGEDVPRAHIAAPRLLELIRLIGTAARPVRNVTLRGLTFADTDWPFPGGRDLDIQAAEEWHGAVRADEARACAIERCVFTRLGADAVDFGSGCESNRVAGNDMFDLGAGGIRLGDSDYNRAVAEPSFGNIISDNHIHHFGCVNAPAAGILALLTSRNLVAHNEIDHGFYTAISVGWSWGYGPNPCRDNIIEWNHLHDLGQGMLSDMGGVYTLGVQPGTIVRQNLIHDVNIFSYGGWGLYTDEGSSGIILESNIVYHCQSAGFHQHYGRGNIVRNNIFAFNEQFGLQRTRVENHLSLSLSNNIVLLDSGHLLGGPWGDDLVMDDNLYFDTRGSQSPLVTDLKTWQERGHDTHSIMADPRFRDAAHFDFRLRAGSPARRVGYQPFDLRGAGPRTVH
jgi:parallel beta-helix repeat protein